MKSFHAVRWLICAFATLATTSSVPGHVYFLDSSAATKADLNDTGSHVRPTTARLILAQRLGLADQFSLSDVDAEGIRHISTYGGSSRHPLIDLSEDTSKSRTVLIVDGISHPDDVLPRQKEQYESFTISPVPNPYRSEELRAELERSLREATNDPSANVIPSFLEDLTTGTSGNFVVSKEGRSIIHLTRLQELEREYGDHSPQYRKEATLIRNAIERLSRTEDLGSLTIVMLPPEHLCAKRNDASATWGKSNWRDSATIKKRSPEVYLGAARKSESSRSSGFVEMQAVASRYPDLAGCQRGTKNCTGHGECRVVYTETVLGRRTDYFGCVCTPSVKDTNAGKKTTYYGGAACQKVDIVGPFWLLAGVTIALIVIVSLGVSMLFSMGSEELPSVIGAGVTGPRAK